MHFTWSSSHAAGFTKLSECSSLQRGMNNICENPNIKGNMFRCILWEKMKGIGIFYEINCHFETCI